MNSVTAKRFDVAGDANVAPDSSADIRKPDVTSTPAAANAPAVKPGDAKPSPWRVRRSASRPWLPGDWGDPF
jgi:hypothetical protein